jgi:hypothetical protein
MWITALVSLLNSLVAIGSLEGLNLPMYNALKRMSSPTAIVTEWLLLGKLATKVRCPIPASVLNCLRHRRRKWLTSPGGTPEFTLCFARPIPCAVLCTRAE